MPNIHSRAIEPEGRVLTAVLKFVSLSSGWLHMFKLMENIQAIHI